MPAKKRDSRRTRRRIRKLRRHAGSDRFARLIQRKVGDNGWISREYEIYHALGFASSLAIHDIRPEEQLDALLAVA